jgi:hypothetical protein
MIRLQRYILSPLAAESLANVRSTFFLWSEAASNDRTVEIGSALPQDLWRDSVQAGWDPVLVCAGPHDEVYQLAATEVGSALAVVWLERDSTAVHRLLSEPDHVLVAQLARPEYPDIGRLLVACPGSIAPEAVRGSFVRWVIDAEFRVSEVPALGSSDEQACSTEQLEQWWGRVVRLMPSGSRADIIPLDIDDPGEVYDVAAASEQLDALTGTRIEEIADDIDLQCFATVDVQHSRVNLVFEKGTAPAGRVDVYLVYTDSLATPALSIELLPVPGGDSVFAGEAELNLAELDLDAVVSLEWVWIDAS